MSSELGNIVQITEQFPLQSYFDAAAEVTNPPSTAALVQPSNNNIVESTLKKKENQSGYAVGLAPWSQAPVALKVNFGEGGNSATVLMRPGQVFRPNGNVRFQGFEYGLPYGWLGGGTVTLFLFKTPNSEVWWEGQQSEVLFHRLRTTITAGPAAAPSFRNWPNRFPWPQMYRLATVVESQQGRPSLTVSRTTKILFRLNQTGEITGDNAATVMFWGTDDFGIGADGVTAVNTDNFFQSIFFPDRTSVAVGGTINPIVGLDPAIAGVPSNTWGINIVAPAASVLVGMTVDICRYGIL